MSAEVNEFTSTINEADQHLIAKIKSSFGVDSVVKTTLRTDERVIARVTDGIYRQPGSALRELISNAYDADATRVVVNTDAPRFERISIEDDGHGMTPEALAHLLLHIGGSAKRHKIGASLGVTATNNPTLSPGGRRLIGKIGIGLFSVSQLTHTFQIITKVKGDSYRTIATVALRQYSDEDAPLENGSPSDFESGRVNIWREKASDTDSHGTSIILTKIRPQARDTLRSRNIWNAIDQVSEREFGVDALEASQSVAPPRYHIGRVDNSGNALKGEEAHINSLPWDEADSPELAFKKLVECVWNEIEFTTPNPQLERIFDYYLRMVWQISLATPLPYVSEHLFDIEVNGWADAYLLSNHPKQSAEPLRTTGSTLREKIGLLDPIDQVGKFDVYFDDLKLSRPIKFCGLPITKSALKTPLVFVGLCREEFKAVPRELSGGTLDFEAYLFWTPKVAPVEHQGALIRIHGSSGTLFDPTFMRYQISEQTRLRQVTCEIFVKQGLDSALNIDRESFNNAHPHVVYITKWLHNALRQLASTQKRIASQVRAEARDESKNSTVLAIQKVATKAWQEETGGIGSAPPDIELSQTGKKTIRSPEAYVYSRAEVMPARAYVNTQKTKARNEIIEEKLKAIAQLLASFNLLDALSKERQERLLRSIYEILDTAEE